MKNYPYPYLCCIAPHDHLIFQTTSMSLHVHCFAKLLRWNHLWQRLTLLIELTDPWRQNKKLIQPISPWSWWCIVKYTIYIYIAKHIAIPCAERSWDDIIKANVWQRANQSASVCRNIMSWILIVKVQKIWQLYHVLVWLSSLDWRRRAWNFWSLCWDGQQIAKSPQHNISTKYHVIICLYCNSQIKCSLSCFPNDHRIINRPHHPPSWSNTKLQSTFLLQSLLFSQSQKQVGKTF